MDDDYNSEFGSDLDYDQGYEDAVFGEDEKATANADYQSGYIDGLRARREQEAEELGFGDDSSDEDVTYDDDDTYDDSSYLK